MAEANDWIIMDMKNDWKTSQQPAAEQAVEAAKQDEKSAE
jgi:hypothetical protein